jgi:hypothetical protein
MCERVGDRLELCAPCRAALDHQRFRLGDWGPIGGPYVKRLALLAGEFRKGAGITLNFCPFTGADIRPPETKEST